MPIYEYEPDDRECLLCEGRIEVMQGVEDPAYAFCPWCGMAVRRIVSRASFQVAKATTPEAAAKKGFSTFRKVEKGKWEKVAGPSEEGVSPPPEGGEVRASDFDEGS